MYTQSLMPPANFTHSVEGSRYISICGTGTKRASSDVVGPTASELDQDATTPRGSTSSKRVSSVDLTLKARNLGRESISQLEEETSSPSRQAADCSFGKQHANGVR